jgi:uncharacterized protein
MPEERMSSQANSNQQDEPTMEEILASIRKIISDDQPSDGKTVARPAVRPQPMVAPEPAAVAQAAEPAADLDVLDLTDEVADDAPQAVTIAPPAPVAAMKTEVAVASTEPVSSITESTMDHDLVSESTRHAMGKAFANTNGQAPQVALKNGSIESIFADAVQQAFRPALKEWVEDHSADVMDQLRPLIRAWMDEHLPSLIQAAVVKEIARAAARKP